MNMFKTNDVVLFQGDSITDVSRSREDDSLLGKGYPMMIRASYFSKYPEARITFLNRGISGNRVKDLQNRLQKDFIDLKPTWISILIGVNDCWRRYDRNDPTSAEEFEERYRDLLTKLRQNTDAKLILCEPFLLHVTPDKAKWREDLDPKIAVVRKLAKEFSTLLVPLDNIFINAAAKRSPEFWSADGVHPTDAGHALIMRAWLDTMKIEL
ncbi:MAG: SGNH/GDSL hydrolase family protein [Ruminiclostridium sp.]|nr:SGNH/GDSL hydrolase family protein [Ruminiclostridium sp.]